MSALAADWAKMHKDTNAVLDTESAADGGDAMMRHRQPTPDETFTGLVTNEISRHGYAMRLLSSDATSYKEL